MTSSAFRLAFTQCQELLRERLAEPAPGRIQLLVGPRQVGKTTLLLGLVREHGDQAIYFAADGPEATLPGSWEQLWKRAERAAADHGRCIVLLDEVHALTEWASRLKAVWDQLQREEAPVHVVASGSSALGLASGSRESLAGRFEQLTLTHWSASSVAQIFEVPPDEAAMLLVRYGAYPGAFPLRDDLPRWTAYLRDAIVAPAIGRDIVSLAPIRKPALLRQIFALAAASPAQVVSLQKLQGQLQDRGALETISHYLSLLEDAFLVAAVGKYAAHAMRRRKAPPKLITLSNALCAAVDARPPPEPDESERFGRWVENACLAHAWNAGQRVCYWREEPLEVDAVIEGSWGQWVVEIKTGSLRLDELRGLLEFSRRYPAFRPLLVGTHENLQVAERAGIAAMTWQRFLLEGV